MGFWKGVRLGSTGTVSPYLDNNYSTFRYLHDYDLPKNVDKKNMWNTLEMPFDKTGDVVQ